MSTDPYRYEGFGLTLASALPLPGLPPSSDDDPDAAVVDASLPATPEGLPDDPVAVHRDADRSVSIHRSERALYWFHDGIGTLRVSDGREIAVSPRAPAADAALARAVLGPGIRSLLLQRGALVLHASAVVVDGSLVAFAGPSGAGKSTAAAACYAAGHAVHADDVVAVASPGDGHPIVPPGRPGLRVSRATADASTAKPVDCSSPGGKGVIDVADRFPGDPMALDAVYLLDDDDRFGVDTVPTPDAAFDLLCASFAPYAESNAEEAKRHLEACATLVDGVDVRLLRRPRSLDRLDELVRLVEADVDSR